MTTIDLRLDDETVEQIAARVAKALGDPAAPWLNVAQAAAYLACNPDRIHDLVSSRKLDVRRDGRRLLFRREWLDAVLA
jgi:excisionase family DNA binding protein